MFQFYQVYDFEAVKMPICSISRKRAKMQSAAK